MKEKKRMPVVFYESEPREIENAGALIMKSMIEKDIINSPDFPEGANPYKWLAIEMNKSLRTIHNWTTEWSATGGAKPTIIDFFYLVHLTKSHRAIEYIEALISNSTLKQKKLNHSNNFKHVARHIRNLADTIEKIAENSPNH